MPLKQMSDNSVRMGGEQANAAQKTGRGVRAAGRAGHPLCSNTRSGPPCSRPREGAAEPGRTREEKSPTFQDTGASDATRAAFQQWRRRRTVLVNGAAHLNNDEVRTKWVGPGRWLRWLECPPAPPPPSTVASWIPGQGTHKNQPMSETSQQIHASLSSFPQDQF